MTTTSLPPQIQLTEDEARLFSQLPERLVTHPGPEALGGLSDMQEILFESVKERIPEIRIRVFSDPDYAEKRDWTPLSRFGNEKNIVRNHNFLPYLRYFILGPELSSRTIEGFRDILDSVQTSGMIQSAIHTYVRKYARSKDLRFRNDIATQFFRLAIEMDYAHEARGIRDAVRSVRSRK